YGAAHEEFRKRAEPEQIEAAGLYPTFEPYPVLPVADPVVEPQQVPQAAAGLRLLDEWAREHSSVWAELLHSKLVDADEIAHATPLLRLLLDFQDARVRAAKEAQIKALVEQWHPIFDADPAQIGRAREAVAAIEVVLIEPLASILTAPDPQSERESALAL